MRSGSLSLAATLLAFAFAQAAVSEQRTLTLDPVESKIHFTVGATLHTVHGTVQVTAGELRFDPAGGPVTGEIVADATSADTEKPGRDKDMHKKVLQSDEFGTFILRPTELIGAVDMSGTSEIELRGEMSIHGGEHPVVLPAKITVEGSRLTGTATLEVPYIEWGMKNPSKLLLRVDKLVNVEITLAGTLGPGTEASD